MDYYHRQAYSPARGLRYRFIANFPTDVEITVTVRPRPNFPGWTAFNGLWKLQ